MHLVLYDATCKSMISGNLNNDVTKEFQKKEISEGPSTLVITSYENLKKSRKFKK